MYTPTTFAQAQEVIRNYQAVVEEKDGVIDCLQRACAQHIGPTEL
jgi:hypothetical protein